MKIRVAFPKLLVLQDWKTFGLGWRDNSMVQSAVALTEVPRLILTIHITWFTTTYNFNSRGPMLSLSPWAPECTCTYINRDIQTCA